ncbi:hypothetical protein M2405_004200 [Rhodococcus erythropolis]|nr:hypothetical protein [Rhodococcus erythropolis]MCW2425414.1 hypothetical protein [Rhodococcus erythropolis]
MIAKRPDQNIWREIGKWLGSVFARFALDQLFDQLVTI